MKKIASLMLALVLVMCANLVVALADPTNSNDFDFNPDTGMITGYHGSGGEVKIPDAIDGKSVTDCSKGLLYMY